MNHRDWRSLVAFSAVGLFIGACSNASPMSPSPATGVVSPASKPSPPPTVVTPLLSGTFTITTRHGTLTATYDGEGSGSGATLTLGLVGGTGAFAGASGTLTGSGKGGFTGEGSFSLAVNGNVTTAAGSRKLRIGIKGTAVVSCVNEVPILTLTGSGHVTGAGRSTAVATHRIGNADCIS